MRRYKNPSEIFPDIHIVNSVIKFVNIQKSCNFAKMIKRRFFLPGTSNQKGREGMNGKQLSVKLDARETVYLEKLARESGRSQGQVLQRLIVFAMNNDDARRCLGIGLINREPNREPIKAIMP